MTAPPRMDAEDIDAWVELLASRGYQRIVTSGHSNGSISVTLHQALFHNPLVVANVHMAPTAEHADWMRRGLGDEKYAATVKRAREFVAAGRGDQVIAEWSERPHPDPYNALMQIVMRAGLLVGDVGPRDHRGAFEADRRGRRADHDAVRLGGQLQRPRPHARAGGRGRSLADRGPALVRALQSRVRRLRAQGRHGTWSNGLPPKVRLRSRRPPKGREALKRGANFTSVHSGRHVVEPDLDRHVDLDGLERDSRRCRSPFEAPRQARRRRRRRARRPRRMGRRGRRTRGEAVDAAAAAHRGPFPVRGNAVWAGVPGVEEEAAARATARDDEVVTFGRLPEGPGQLGFRGNRDRLGVVGFAHRRPIRRLPSRA